MKHLTSKIAVVHRDCGHACSVSDDRAGAERLQSMLAVGGYHQWRVRRIAPDDLEAVLTGLLTSDPQAGGCQTCRIDQDRVLALLAAQS